MIPKQPSPYKHLKDMIDEENIHMVLSRDKRIELMRKLTTVELINSFEALLVKYEELLKAKNLFEEYKFEVSNLIDEININETENLDEAIKFYKNFTGKFSELNKNFSTEKESFEENFMAKLASNAYEDSKVKLKLTGPINDFFYKHSIMLVYGTMGGQRYNKVLEDCARSFAFTLSRKIKTQIILKKDVDITRDDIKNYHMIIFGGPGLNEFLEEISDELPLQFDMDCIKIGDMEFTGDDDRIIMLCANPLNLERYILIYSATGIEGLKDLYGVYHGPTDFVVGNSYNWLVKGYFDKSDESLWQYSSKDININKGLMEMLNKDGWDSTDSKHYIFYYQKGSTGERDIKDIINLHENNYPELLKYSKIPSDEVVDIYLFEDNIQKEEIVGSKADASFDHFSPKIYMVYNEAVRKYGVDKILRPVYRHINWAKGTTD